MYKCLILSLFIACASTIIGYNNPHFYRATPLFFEARYDRSLLSTLDISASGGSTKCALNRCGNKVPLLDIYGTSNMLALGANVPGKDPSNPLDLILIQLGLIAGRDGFGTFSTHGTFDIKELTFSWVQNIYRGFFLQAYLPYRKLSIDNIAFCDLSPCGPPCPNINTPLWKFFKQNFFEILARYGLSADPTDEHGIGDFAFFLGWTHSYDRNPAIDFVDSTVQVGFIAPTGKKQNPDSVFSLPLGYNGHWGIPFIFNFAFGTHNCFTMAFHASAIVFASTERDARVYSSSSQSGIIKLAKLRVCEEKGAIWSLGSYIKADHFCRGLSVLAGYSFANQQNDFFTSVCGTRCDSLVANCDGALQGWKMHTIHFWAELDFTLLKCSWGPRFAFFYNLIVGGERIFKTNMAGGIVGVDIGWYL